MKRNLANKINTLLESFPVVAILGARQVGKTTLSQLLRPDWQYFDLEQPSTYNRMSNDPELFFEQVPEAAILDEAQNYPPLFNVLRGVVDNNRTQKGRFILTGSSSPTLRKNITESLAGRVAIVELGTLKLNEAAEQPLSGFYDIFDQPLTKDALSFGKPPFDFDRVQQHWLSGGYPEPMVLQSQTQIDAWMTNYEYNYINRDVADLFPSLNKQAYQRFVAVLSKLSSTILNKADLARSLEVSQGSIRKYLDIMSGTYLWRELTAYEKSATKSVVKMPKGYMRDTGLLHHLLHISSLEALQNHPIVGHSFEGFVIEEILKGIEAKLFSKASHHYFRTHHGAEIDLILEGTFGTLPIEIKYSKNLEPKKLRAIENFVVDNNLPFGLIVHPCATGNWITRHLYQLPVGWI